MLNIHYIAGIMDGEGSFGLYKNNKRKTIRTSVAIVNSYKPLLLEIKNQFGGYLYLTKKDTRKKVWLWQVTGPIAINFSKTIEPYLLEKKPQAQLLIAYQDWRNRQPKHFNIPWNEIYWMIDEIKKLKKISYD